MKRFLIGLTACLATCLPAWFSFADDAKPAEKPAAKSEAKPGAKPAVKSDAKAEARAKQKGARKAHPVFQLPDSVALSDEQKEKLAALQKEYQPQLDEVQKPGDILTDEQKEKLKKLQQEAKASGKKGRELRAEIDSALNLTDEQKQKQRDAKEKASALQKTVREKVLSLLTEDQKKAVESTKGKAAKNPKAAKTE